MLACLDIGSVVNWDVFKYALTDEERDRLMTMLPSCDTESVDSIKELFDHSTELRDSVSLYQRHLMSGSFDAMGARNFARSNRKKQRLAPPLLPLASLASLLVLHLVLLLFPLSFLPETTSNPPQLQPPRRQKAVL
jgi:hypothetical protein